MMLGKLFEDMLSMENGLELDRKYKLSQINIRDSLELSTNKAKAMPHWMTTINSLTNTIILTNL